MNSSKQMLQMIIKKTKKVSENPDEDKLRIIATGSGFLLMTMDI